MRLDARLAVPHRLRLHLGGHRLDLGRQKMKEYADVFARAEQEFGVPAPVITAFWAMETDFGAVQGDFNTRNALVTLAHDCRRPEMFRPQLLAAIEMVQHGDLDPGRHQLRSLLASHPTWEIIIRGYAAKGLFPLPAMTSIDALIT